MVDKSPESESLAISTQEAAHRLGIDHTTLKRKLRAGEIDSFTIGRRRLVPIEAIDRYVESRILANRLEIASGHR